MSEARAVLASGHPAPRSRRASWALVRTVIPPVAVQVRSDVEERRVWITVPSQQPAVSRRPRIRAPAGGSSREGRTGVLSPGGGPGRAGGPWRGAVDPGGGPPPAWRPALAHPPGRPGRALRATRAGVLRALHLVRPSSHPQ